MPNYSREELAAARLDADATRAEWLIGITSDVLTVADLIEQARLDEGKPLRAITLRQLLLAQPRWGRLRVRSTLAKLREASGSDLPEKNLTVGWLIDSRYEHRNMLAWIDAMQKEDFTPWAGFPFSPAPEVAR